MISSSFIGASLIVGHGDCAEFPQRYSNIQATKKRRKKTTKKTHLSFSSGGVHFYVRVGVPAQMNIAKENVSESQICVPVVV